MTADRAIPDALVATLREARRICVLTGAGVSAESGVPTFRDAQQGLWASYDPRQLATPEAFVENPKLIWDWYRWRRKLVSKVDPNRGHRALAALQKRVPAFSLITQNVDGLHQRAGSADVIEFHGNLFVSRCSVEGCVVDPADTEDVPVCPRCGAPARPGVIWFGEAIPEDAMAASLAAAADCELFMSIGTSSQVFPAASLFDLARDTGAVTVEINPQPTDRAAQFDFALAGKSGVVVPKLLEFLIDELQHDGPETT